MLKQIWPVIFIYPERWLRRRRGGDDWGPYRDFANASVRAAILRPASKKPHSTSRK